MITVSNLRGWRQRERAQMIIDQMEDPDKARWQAPFTQLDIVVNQAYPTLLLGENTQHAALAQWVKDETLLEGASVKLIHYWQKCDCPEKYTQCGHKLCKGHERIFTVPFSGYHLRYWLDEYKNSPDCNGIVGYLDGVLIGCL